MDSSAQVVFNLCAHLCVPASGVLAGALGSLCRRRPRGRGSVHRGALAAHISTLICFQFVRVLYLLDIVQCLNAVPVQNCFDLSANCWVHTICINFALRFRDSHNAKESYITLLVGMVYSCCTPLVIMITLEHYVEGTWLTFTAPLYDLRTCFFDEDSFLHVKSNDLSLQLAIIRGITILITSILFIYLSYKTGYQRKNVVLCHEDVDSIADVTSRQNQAMKYILTMVATGVTEVCLDVGSWYFADQLRSAQLPNLDNKLAEWVTKSVSFCVDFARALLILDLVWWDGPAPFSRRRSDSEDALPPYELATDMPRPSQAALAEPPPSYAFVVGQRGRRAEDETALLDTPPSSLAASTSSLPMLAALEDLAAADNLK